MTEEISKEAKEFRDNLLNKYKDADEETKEFVKTIVDFNKEMSDEDIEKAREKLREAYWLTKEVIEEYIEMKPEYYNLIAIWILGTWFHKSFATYPYLFFNAMRGTAKTRTLNLIKTLSREGILMSSPTEAVLFRSTGTLAIDELESIGSKEKANIRELLNVSYKAGGRVFRMQKRKIKGEEKQVLEEFDVFRPIVMANIRGMEEVLGDRCLQIILEKSDDPIRTRLTEIYEEDEKVQKILKLYGLVYRVQCIVEKKHIYKLWNMYIKDKYRYTLNTYNTYNTYYTHYTLPNNNSELDSKTFNLFNKIDETDIKGRNLELFLPLFFLANIISYDVLDSLLKIASEMVVQKKEEEVLESIDVIVYEFVSKKESGLFWYSMKDLTNEFKSYVEEDYEWLNSIWFGKALKRLNLVIDKKRVGKGKEVILNVAKAKEKLKIFQREEKYVESQGETKK